MTRNVTPGRQNQVGPARFKFTQAAGYLKSVKSLPPDSDAGSRVESLARVNPAGVTDEPVTSVLPHNSTARLRSRGSSSTVTVGQVTVGGSATYQPDSLPRKFKST